jgi:arylsulfatase A-like enzyme
VGALLAAVRERFGAHALVLFSADHGEMLGNHRLWGKNNCAYEDVWNVPLLARFPAGAPGAALHGTVQHARVMLTDVAPTCLRAAGLDGTLDVAGRIDGRPLEDQVAAGGREFVFAEGEGFLAVSDGRTKYVAARPGAQRPPPAAVPGATVAPAAPAAPVLRELLDLEADPHEFHNVLGRPAYAARHLRLAGALEDLLAGALLP